jgi:heme/copper-type cytochrome/quinol oxidase subunit 2
MQENFSLDDLNPMEKIKKLGMFLLIWLIKALVFGGVIYGVMSKTGLMNEASIKNYFMYFVAGSLIMFLVTFGYFAFLCRKNKFDATKLAKLSILGPSVILIHIIALIVASFLVDIPEIGLIIYGIAWSSIGVMLVTGIMYSIGLSIAELKAECGTLF